MSFANETGGEFQFQRTICGWTTVPRAQMTVWRWLSGLETLQVGLPIEWKKSPQSTDFKLEGASSYVSTATHFQGLLSLDGQRERDWFRPRAQVPGGGPAPWRSSPPLCDLPDLSGLSG